MNLKKTVFIFTSVFFFYSILFMSCKQKNKSSQKLADKAEVQKLEQQMKEQLTLKGVSVSAIQTPKKLPHGIDIFDSAEEKARKNIHIFMNPILQHSIMNEGL